jgi:hypothetical protein
LVITFKRLGCSVFILPSLFGALVVPGLTFTLR